MYNGIGLQTPRGSGTNGHVQRNWAFVRPGKKDNVAYKTEEDISKLEATLNRQPNQAILDHERKRKIEVKCAEFEEILEKQGYDAENIKTKIESYRAKLLGQGKGEIPKDEFGRIAVRETHQIAEAQQEKNAKLREAFGISEYFVEGTSFDPDRKAKEELAKSAVLLEELSIEKETEKGQLRKYALVRTPSVEKDIKKPNKGSNEKKKKKRKHRETSSSPERKKKKKSKKHKKERSKKKKSKKRKEKGDTDSSGNSDSDNDSSESENEKKRKKAKKDKKKREKKKKDRSVSVESRSSYAGHRLNIHQKKTKEKETLSRKSYEIENRDRNKDSKQNRSYTDDLSSERQFSKQNPPSTRTQNTNRNKRNSQSPSEINRNVESHSSQHRKSRSRSRKDKSRKINSRSPLEGSNNRQELQSEKESKSHRRPHTPNKINRKKSEGRRSSFLERSRSRTPQKKKELLAQEQLRRGSGEYISVGTQINSDRRKQERRSPKGRSFSSERKVKKVRKHDRPVSRSDSHSNERIKNSRKRSATKENSPTRQKKSLQYCNDKPSSSKSPSPKKERVNPFRTGNNHRITDERLSASPRNARQRDSPYLSNKSYSYRRTQRSFSRSPSRTNHYSSPTRRRRSLSREPSKDQNKSRGKSPKVNKHSRYDSRGRDLSLLKVDDTLPQRYTRETSKERKQLQKRNSSPKKDLSFRDSVDKQQQESRLMKGERSIHRDKLHKSPLQDNVHRRSPSKRRSPSLRREDFLKSPVKKTSKGNSPLDTLNKSPLQGKIKQNRNTRSNSSSSESSDLSYSPAKRDPERYRALLEQVKKETKEKDALKSPKKRSSPTTVSSKRNRSKSKDNRRAQNIHLQPRVHLHSPTESDSNESASEEIRNRNVEKFIEAIVNEKKDENRKDLQKDMELLKALKSGIAAKAKEKIKKIEKMATEINEPLPVAQTSVLPLHENNLVETIVAKVTNSTAVAAVAAAVAAEKKSPKNRSQSKHKLRQRCSRSGSRSSYSSTSSSSTGTSRSRSRSSGSSRSSRSSRSKSFSSATSRENSGSRSRSATRSPSIPRRRGSPSFLDRRRITSKSKYRR